LRERCRHGAGKANSGAAMRWTFTDIKPDSFHWMFQFRRDCTNNTCCYLVLKFEDVLISPSKRSAQRCVPVEASMSCPVIRSRFPDLRTLPSST
jgi:hypothetical protein